MMNLVSWKPLRPFGDLFSRNRQINRFFDEAFGDTDNRTLPDWYPAADIYETKDDYVFKLEVPGLNKDDINIELKDHTLSVEGEKKEEKPVTPDSAGDGHKHLSWPGQSCTQLRKHTAKSGNDKQNQNQTYCNTNANKYSRIE